MVSVFVEIQLKSVCLCCGLIVGEVFKLLEEEGVSLSELEPAPLDSLYVAPAMSGSKLVQHWGALDLGVTDVLVGSRRDEAGAGTVLPLLL